MKTVVHVTHEALQKVGGIGAVLQGLCTSEAYLARVQRNILIGPMFGGPQAATEQLAKFGEVYYSSALSIDNNGWWQKFRHIQEELGVNIIYGRREFRDEETGRASKPEVLLFGIEHMHAHPLAVFKLRLYERFHIQSDIYDAWDYEQYLRIALPAYKALAALGVDQADEPATIMAHEYMGMPTALLAILENNRRYRTVFYAHEAATIRRIVEKHLGHDTMFYNVMRQAMSEGKYVDEVFGSQKSYFKHPLVAASRHCDCTLAVGDFVREELRFLHPDFAKADLRLAYNGIPSHQISSADRNRSRKMVQSYLEKLTGARPDYVFTHVTRLALSKGLWRDLKVLWRMEQAARKAGWTATFVLLSTELGGPRRPNEILHMEALYGWPLAHREGYPDLSGGEAEFYASVQRFNLAARNVKVIFVNQFGWSTDACGKVMPPEMNFMDLRKAADVEFGQSIYEPFGIAQLEPLAFGGICVPTALCGCAGFFRQVAGDGDSPNAVLADYTHLPAGFDSLDRMMHIGLNERQAVEETESARVAKEILRKLPKTDQDRDRLLASGYALAKNMGWDAVSRDYVLPAMADIDAKA